MPYKMHATLTSKGQVTLPAKLRKLLGLAAGDRLDFTPDGHRVIMTKRRQKSIFERLKELPPLSMDRPLTQGDIDRAVAEAMAEQELRVRRGTSG